MQTALVAAGNGPTISWAGGAGTLYASGSFGGGSGKMQYLPTGQSDTDANWIDVPGAAISTQARAINFDLPAGDVRLVLVNLSSTPNLPYDFVGR